jgi:rubredoxin
MQPEPDFVVDPNQVAEHHACPQCGERRTDFLEWLDDDRVKCQTCNTIYGL